MCDSMSMSWRCFVLICVVNIHFPNHQVEYKKDYEKKKDKYTTVVDTPEHLRTTKVNKQISDVSVVTPFQAHLLPWILTFEVW